MLARGKDIEALLKKIRETVNDRDLKDDQKLATISATVDGALGVNHQLRQEMLVDIEELKEVIGRLQKILEGL